MVSFTATLVYSVANWHIFPRFVMENLATLVCTQKRVRRHRLSRKKSAPLLKGHINAKCDLRTLKIDLKASEIVHVIQGYI
jgi:hypothetical protein